MKANTILNALKIAFYHPSEMSVQALMAGAMQKMFIQSIGRTQNIDED
ncbi:hypothetical protein [Lactococcus cremoris]|nr:hypothetical protein [Lactococcus cremoris]